MDVAIIGGGASGMLLAAMINKNNINVTILEKNPKLGRKLLLTGNGKCNFTSGEFKNVNDIYNSNFACSLYKNHNEIEFINFFKSIGIDNKIEIHRGLKYYYPRSNKSTSVYYNLLDKIVANGANIIYNSNVIDIKRHNNKFILELSNKKTFTFDKVVIATGGKSYKNTGSDGSGYILASKLSHNIVEPLPGLTSLKSDDTFLKDLKGIRTDAIVTVVGHDNISETGEVQFTEFGISGIPILNISSKINRLLSNGQKITLSLNFFNDFKYLKQRLSDIPYKKQSDFLCGILPDELSYTIMKESKAKMAACVSDIDDELFNRICKCISNFIINISSYSCFDVAQITIGGVDTNDISNDTLESKLVNGLYFIGEVLDIDGKCGGYNLQLAYSTARCVYGGLCGN